MIVAVKLGRPCKHLEGLSEPARVYLMIGLLSTILLILNNKFMEIEYKILFVIFNV